MRPPTGVIVRKKKDVVPKPVEVPLLLDLQGDGLERVADAVKSFYTEDLTKLGISLEPPPIESFKGIGTEQTRAQDEARVIQLRNNFDARGTESGNALERMVEAEVARNGWFGGAKYVRTTAFDDYTNGTDAVLTWDKPGAPRIGLDMTVNAEALEKKLFREVRVAPNRFELVPREKASVTYYRGPDGKEESLRDIPRGVLGLEQGYLAFIMQDRLAKKSSDWVETIFLAQLIGQLLNTLKNNERSTEPAKKKLVNEAEAALEMLVPAYEKKPEDRLKVVAAQSAMFRRLAPDWKLR